MWRFSSGPPLGRDPPRPLSPLIGKSATARDSSSSCAQAAGVELLSVKSANKASNSYLLITKECISYPSSQPIWFLSFCIVSFVESDTTAHTHSFDLSRFASFAFAACSASCDRSRLSQSIPGV